MKGKTLKRHNLQLMTEVSFLKAFFTWLLLCPTTLHFLIVPWTPLLSLKVCFPLWVPNIGLLTADPYPSSTLDLNNAHSSMISNLTFPLQVHSLKFVYSALYLVHFLGGVTGISLLTYMQLNSWLPTFPQTCSSTFLPYLSKWQGYLLVSQLRNLSLYCFTFSCFKQVLPYYTTQWILSFISSAPPWPKLWVSLAWIIAVVSFLASFSHMPSLHYSKHSSDRGLSF